MKHSILIIFFTSYLSFMGQKETLVFNISKPESLITIATPDTVFRVGQRNIFNVTTTGNDKIYRVDVHQGKVTRLAAGVYDVVFEKPGPTFIKVYTIDPKGEKKIGLVQPIAVLGLPAVEVFLCGVKGDSSLDLQHLIDTKQLTARMKEDKYDYKPQVMSFSMIMQQDTFKINGDKIPITLKNKLYDLEAGDAIEILETNVMLPNVNKNIVRVPSFTIYLVRTDQHTIGERKHINPVAD